MGLTKNLDSKKKKNAAAGKKEVKKKTKRWGIDDHPCPEVPTSVFEKKLKYYQSEPAQRKIRENYGKRGKKFLNVPMAVTKKLRDLYYKVNKVEVEEMDEEKNVVGTKIVKEYVYDPPKRVVERMNGEMPFERPRLNYKKEVARVITLAIVDEIGRRKARLVKLKNSQPDSNEFRKITVDDVMKVYDDGFRIEDGLVINWQGRQFNFCNSDKVGGQGSKGDATKRKRKKKKKAVKTL
jgi:hypothetical protein